MTDIDKLSRDQYWRLYAKIYDRLPGLSFPHAQLRCSKMLSKMRQSQHMITYTKGL